MKYFSLRIPNELMLLLKNDTEKLGISINALILNILWDRYRE